jgi:hypothetical protein
MSGSFLVVLFRLTTAMSIELAVRVAAACVRRDGVKGPTAKRRV